MVVSIVKLSRGCGPRGVCCGRERDESQTPNLAYRLTGELVQELDGSLTPPAWSHQFTGLFRAPGRVRTTRFRSVPTLARCLAQSQCLLDTFCSFAGQVQNCIRDLEEKAMWQESWVIWRQRPFRLFLNVKLLKHSKPHIGITEKS